MSNCSWSYDPDHCKWDTECSEAFCLNNDSTLAENQIRFCPFCGRSITEASQPANEASE